MTRVQAKIYAELSRKDIEQIDKGLAEHYDLIRAFSNGAEIEYFDFTLEDWFSTNDPAFWFHFKYRVKPNDAAQSSEPWKPKRGDCYYILDEYGDVNIVNFIDSSMDASRINFGNCFQTRKEAEAARERVRAALKGETISKK